MKRDNCSKGSKLHEHDLVIRNEKVYEYENFNFYVNED